MLRKPALPARAWLYFVMLGLALLYSPALQAREAGWVPLEQNRAANIRKPARPAVPKQKAASKAITQKTPGSAQSKNVYDNQPPVNEKELGRFVALLPQFRIWARKNGEEAHPVVDKAGNPDFSYSANAAQWVRQQDFDPQRFFCIMGRLAAGLVIVEEGNDYKGTRPADMPPVAPQELQLVRRHLGELLTAGGPAMPLKAE